jgi:hypothetical protein
MRNCQPIRSISNRFASAITSGSVNTRRAASRQVALLVTARSGWHFVVLNDLVK